MSTFFTDRDFFEEISPEALDIGTNYESVGFGSQGEEAGGFLYNEMGGRGAFAGLGSDEIPRAAPSSAPGGLGTQVVRSDNPGSPSDNPLSLHSQLRAPPQMPQLFMMPTNDAAPAAAPAAATAAATAAQQHSSSASPPACISISSSPLESPRGLPGSPASAETLRPLQNGRPLVPHPASGLPQDAATTQSTVTNSTSPPQLGGGPVSKTHVIQPRPKPGRKPATEEPESKRKAQNRQSQRNFRERKQKTVSDLQDALGQLNVQLRDERASHVRQLNLLENDVKHWKQQAEHWKDEFHRLQHELLTRGNQFAPRTYYINGPQHSTPLRKSFDDSFDAPAAVLSPQPTESGCDRCTSEHCPCIAEMINDRAFQGDASASIDGDAMTGILRGGQGEPDNAETEGEKSADHAEHETDFTFAFRKSKIREGNPTEFLSSAEDAKFPDCGFCEGQPESCICKNMRVDGGEETSLLARNTTSSSAEETKPNTVMTGPGSCADCQANPEQRAWCQRVAQLRSEATPPNSRRNSSKSVTLGTMEPKASTSIDMNSPVSSPVGTGGTVGCSDAFKLLVGRVNPEMNWRQLKPVLPSFAQQDARRNSFSMEPGMYSAMELDASSILTTLQHAPGPLRPRPSDGTYAQLIQEAEERRRMSFSPMTKPNDHTMLDSST